MLEPRPRWVQKLDPIALVLGRMWFAPFGYVNDSWALTSGRIQLGLFFMFAVVMLIFALVSAINAIVR